MFITCCFNLETKNVRMGALWLLFIFSWPKFFLHNINIMHYLTSWAYMSIQIFMKNCTMSYICEWGSALKAKLQYNNVTVYVTWWVIIFGVDITFTIHFHNDSKVEKNALKMYIFVYPDYHRLYYKYTSPELCVSIFYLDRVCLIAMD